MTPAFGIPHTSPAGPSTALPSSISADARYGDPRALLLLLTGATVSAVLLPADLRLGLLAALLMLSAAVTGTPGALLRKLRIVVPMTLAIGIAVALQSPGEQLLWRIIGIEITREGVTAGGVVALRLLLVAASSLLFTLLVPISDAVAALRQLLVPSTVVAVAWLTDRFLTLLAADARRMMESVQARSAALSLPRRISLSTRVSGTFLVRAVGRSDTLADAMTARGFDGRIPALRILRWRRRDTVISAAGLALLFLIWLLPHAWMQP